MQIVSTGDNTGNATVTNVGTTARILSYNSGSPRFACYGNSNQQRVRFYKQVSSGPTQLAAPTNFSATAGNNQATFSWTAVDHASSYTIIRKTGSTWTADNDTVELFKNVNLDNNGQFIGTGLANSSEYVCRVRANGDGTNYSNSALSETTATFTPTNTQQYTVSIADGITGGTVGANPTTATAGTTIQVTANATVGYHLTALSYTDGSTTTDINTTTMQFTMPASDVTINATFTPYTVTLNANSSTSTWNVTMNGGNLPDAPAPCASWSFYGWSTSAVGSQTTTAPTCVNGTGYAPTGNITLYAVYKKTEGGGNTDGTVTLASGVYNSSTPATITWTEDYITILQEKGTSSSAVSNSYISNPRWYQNHVITMTPTSTVNSITITQYDGKYGLEDSDTSITNGSASVDNHVVTITPTNGNQAVVITMGAQARISAISVNYVGSTTYYHSYPDCTETVATPSFDVNEGTYYEPQIIIIECETAGASIYYTLNGEEPTSTESATNFLYDENEGVEISSTTTLKAKAFKTGMNPSATRTATYTIIHDVAEPTLAESQLFTTDTYSVAITVPANTTVYYTTDGTAPTNASTQYTAAFNINATTTVKAIAYDGDGCASDVVTATFTRAYTLAGAKALYEVSDVTNVTISLNGVQFIAKSGSSTYMQQGTTGLMIYGSHSQDLTKGDVFTAGTVTGTITKYGENLELSISSDAFANVAKTAGTLTASATDVEITDVTGDFSTYESRYVALESLEMSVTDKTLSDGTNTLAIYDPFHVLDEAIQPDDDVIVTGVVTSYYKNSNTTYQIIPLDKSGITTGIAATLPTLNPAGGADAAHAVSTETVIVTPATSTTVTYSFGTSAYGEIDAETEITVPSTEATELEVVASRDFYTDNSASYYYMSAAASYTVYFYENGTLTYYEDNVLSGTSLAISSTTAPNGYEFMGWTTAAISGVQAGAPATLYNGSVTVDDNMDLYAVYALEGEASVSYNKVDGYSSITEGTYLIAVNKVDSDNYNFANGQAASGHAGVEATGVATATSYTASDIPEGALEYTLAGNNTDGFSIHCFSGYLNATSAKASLSYGNTATETWIFSDKDGGLVLTGANNSSKASCNSTTAASAIRNYTSTGSHYDPLYFFKKAETPAYSNYCTRVSVPSLPLDEGELTEDYTIPTGAAYTLTSPITVPLGKTLTVPANAVFANADPANLIIEDGGQLICSNSVAATVKKSIANANAKDPKNHWYTISAPVHTGSNNYVTIGNETTVNLTNTGAYDMFAYEESTHTWLNQKNNGEANGFDKMYAGQGYIYRNSGNELSYVGNTTVGPVNIALSYTSTLDVADLKGFNLIGNPYTHSIAKGSGKAIDNTKLSTGCYALTNSGTWTIIEDGNEIKPNQGVLVEVSETVADFQIKDINYVAPTPDPGKYNNDNIKFIVESSEYSDAAYAWFDKGIGLTKINHRNEIAPMLYIPQDDNNYAIATMTDDTKAFNLNFKAATAGKYTLSYKATGNYNYLHVIDRMTGEDVDMLLEGEYSFIGTPKDSENRFIVRLEYMPNYSEDGNDIFAYQSGSDIYVSGQGELQIFDVTGRRVMTTTIYGAESINLSAQGVYIFKLNEKVQKIVVR